MEMLSGAEMVVRSLIDQGVKQVFGYPGGAVLDIYGRTAYGRGY